MTDTSASLNVGSALSTCKLSTYSREGMLRHQYATAVLALGIAVACGSTGEDSSSKKSANGGTGADSSGGADPGTGGVTGGSSSTGASDAGGGDTGGGNPGGGSTGGSDTGGTESGGTGGGGTGSGGDAGSAGASLGGMAGADDETGGNAGTGGFGGEPPLPECHDSESCGDGDDCSIDSCVEGVCQHETPPTLCELAGSSMGASCLDVTRGVASKICVPPINPYPGTTICGGDSTCEDNSPGCDLSVGLDTIETSTTATQGGGHVTTMTTTATQIILTGPLSYQGTQCTFSTILPIDAVVPVEMTVTTGPAAQCGVGALVTDVEADVDLTAVQFVITGGGLCVAANALAQSKTARSQILAQITPWVETTMVSFLPDGSTCDSCEAECGGLACVD